MDEERAPPSSENSATGGQEQPLGNARRPPAREKGEEGAAMSVDAGKRLYEYMTAETPVAQDILAAFCQVYLPMVGEWAVQTEEGGKWLDGLVEERNKMPRQLGLYPFDKKENDE
jgi:hypothetical protein